MEYHPSSPTPAPPMPVPDQIASLATTSQLGTFSRCYEAQTPLAIIETGLLIIIGHSICMNASPMPCIGMATAFQNVGRVETASVWNGSGKAARKLRRAAHALAALLVVRPSCKAGMFSKGQYIWIAS